MKRFAMAIALTCILAVSAFAGDIPTVPGPPPPGAGQVAPSPGDIPSVPGEIPTGGLAQEITEEFLLAIFGMFAR